MTHPSAIQALGAAKTDTAAAGGAPKAAAGPAVVDQASGAVFEANLAKASGAAAGSKAETAAVEGRPVSAVYRGSRSGVLSPTQQFESFVLRSFVETMLPKDNESFFGSGTAGSIWKSMLAERIGDEMAKDGGIGIAELLEKRGANAAETAKAQESLAREEVRSVGSEALKGAGSL